jgi:hypothetical protein
LIDERDGAEKYDSFVIYYNYEREHGGTEVHEMLITTDVNTLKQDK